jgi:hypothetical protein
MTRNAYFILAACLFTGSTLAHAAGGTPTRDPSRGVFPGAHLEADSSLVLTQDRALRIPGTSRIRADLPEGTRLTRATTIKVRAQGKAYDVEMWKGIRPDSSGEGGFAESVAVLAVLPEGGNEPTDVAEVATDRETYLNEKLVSLGNDDAFEILNAHLSAGEDHNQTSLFHLRGGRLRRIAEVGIFSEITNNCAKSFADKLHWVVEPQAGGMPRIVQGVETIHAPKGFEMNWDKCRSKEKHRHALTTYRWDAAQGRYVKEAGQKLH